MRRLLLNIFAAICGVVIISLPSKADDNTIIRMQTAGDYYEVYARGIGSGTTLALAKKEAIDNILPQLISKTIDIGSLSSYTSINGTMKGQGIDEIRANTYLKGYWQLEDGIYTYNIELLIKNSDTTEDAEKP